MLGSVEVELLFRLRRHPFAIVYFPCITDFLTFQGPVCREFSLWVSACFTANIIWVNNCGGVLLSIDPEYTPSSEGYTFWLRTLMIWAHLQKAQSLPHMEFCTCHSLLTTVVRNSQVLWTLV